MPKSNSLTKTCNTAVYLFEGKTKKLNKSLETQQKLRQNIFLMEQQDKFTKFHEERTN